MATCDSVKKHSLADGKPVVIGNVCAHVFRQFRKYLYNGTVDKAPSKATFKVNYPININPERYEKDLQIEYERGVSELACFYKFAEDHDISDLMNTIADALQDSVYESGAGLSAFMNDHIIAKSNKGSKLRE
ncbi:hypothetical protein M7I_6635 [Glarea lozoyensis 74030]|uniref:Uncharacterized protein n=1 Tax=Glarea lozoyensis (strain ATCC 74030 / MF5533) TaxID=1104152 RepID=H0EV42_GLAL7|nr:hypothetical protein M7I_6635 [Glarea lozoyensis 74030]